MIRRLFLSLMFLAVLALAWGQLEKPSNRPKASDIETPISQASDIVYLPVTSEHSYETLRDSGGVVLRDSGGNELRVIQQ